jgi:hypothetical protein
VLILGICIGGHATEQQKQSVATFLIPIIQYLQKLNEIDKAAHIKEKHFLTCRLEQSEFARRKVVISTKPTVGVAANFVSAP